METVRFLTACAQVEDKAAEIYRAMADAAQAQNDNELAVLWREMADDEENHAHQVRLAMRLSRQNIFAELKSEEKNTPFTMLEHADALLQRVKASTLDEGGMLKVAVELEKHFQTVHTAYFVLFNDPSMKKMFDALARADDKHLMALRARIGKFRKEQPDLEAD